MDVHTEYAPAAPGTVLSTLDEVRAEVSLLSHPSYNRLRVRIDTELLGERDADGDRDAYDNPHAD